MEATSESKNAKIKPGKIKRGLRGDARRRNGKVIEARPYSYDMPDGRVHGERGKNLAA